MGRARIYDANMGFFSLAPPPTAPALSRTTAPSPPPSNKPLSPPPASVATTEDRTTTTVASPLMVSPPPPISGYQLPSWPSWPVLLPSSCEEGKARKFISFPLFQFYGSDVSNGGWELGPPSGGNVYKTEVLFGEVNTFQKTPSPLRCPGLEKASILR